MTQPGCFLVNSLGGVEKTPDVFLEIDGTAVRYPGIHVGAQRKIRPLGSLRHLLGQEYGVNIG